LQPGAYVYDTVIVGGGPAGLSAALVLGRCGRRILLCDGGTPRNARSRELHGFLTRDGIAPMELLRLGREELRRYGIETLARRVVDIQPRGDGFEVSLSDDRRLEARTVLLACGVCDDLPAIPGLDACFGVSAHHCPYCDGWEERNKAITVIGRRAGAAGLALALKTWSGSVTLCSNGPAELRAAHRRQLADHSITIEETPIAAIEHTDGLVERLVFANGGGVACGAIFLSMKQRPQSDLPRRLGCELTRGGLVKTDHLGRTCVAGVYVVGDASRDVQFAVVAASEGAKAGVAINKALQARTGLAVAG
jgi:thioredoxin reductase